MLIFKKLHKLNIYDELKILGHYTRTRRLRDHHDVIDHLKSFPPFGWNGKLIFLGVSEGGPLVTSLTEDYSSVTLATKLVGCWGLAVARGTVGFCTKTKM